MTPAGRKLVPWAALALLAAATVWALSSSTLPPADLTYCNGTEMKTIDPGKVTGMPEGRVIANIFEGLCRRHPDDLHPIPGMAERWTESPDKKQYTFYLRDNAKWSDGSPVTADDFFYSFQRILLPETQGEYTSLLWYVKNAKRYSTMKPAVGERVEVELKRSDKVVNTVRGEILRGVLREIRAEGDNKAYVVEIDGKLRTFSASLQGEGIEPCAYVLLDFELVGIRVDGPRTLTITLENPTPYFLDLISFYPLSPVNRACLEKYGSPEWTQAENLVTNGAYRVQFRRIRDRTRLVKSEHYWNRDEVQLNIIDVLAVESPTTMLNMYLTGQADWISDVPAPIAPELYETRRSEYDPSPLLGTYFYRFNVTKPPFNNVNVRRALTMAIDRQTIVTAITRTGQEPAFSLVPPGLEKYTIARCAEENLDEARRLLTEAGYPEGKGFPRFNILYNSHEGHKAIAEAIQNRWKRELGIDVRLQNQEWGVYQDLVRKLDYQVARASWIGDYPYPNTFLDMFTSENENNQTGWKNSRYDELIELANAEADLDKRMNMLHEAEQIMMNELPIFPIYYYRSRDMVQTYLSGYHANLRDEHPFWAISLDRDAKRRILAGGTR